MHEYGAKTKFVAASTGKILAAAAYYHLVETGKASLTARMGASTAGQQIRQMVQQSNNESWALILAAVGHKGLTDYAASLGIPYDRTVNGLTPAEMAKTLSELYSGRLLNAGNTAQLLSYMQNTNYEVLIPAAAPPGVSVFHKYGLLNGNLHDASILVQGGAGVRVCGLHPGPGHVGHGGTDPRHPATHRHGRRRTLLTKPQFPKGAVPQRSTES